MYIMILNDKNKIFPDDDDKGNKPDTKYVENVPSSRVYHIHSIRCQSLIYSPAFLSSPPGMGYYSQIVYVAHHHFLRILKILLMAYSSVESQSLWEYIKNDWNH